MTTKIKPQFRYVHAKTEEELNDTVNNLLLEGWKIKGIVTRYKGKGGYIFNVMLIIGDAYHIATTRQEKQYEI